MSRSPLLLGHRGARSIPGVAENTFAAFDLAISSGCDGFEFDVRLSADGIAVVAHDHTTNGHDITNIPAAQLPALPRLEAVLEKYAEHAVLDIELKVPGSGGAAIAAIHKCLPQHCIVSSFLPAVLYEVRELHDSIALGFICDDPEKLPQWRGLPCDYVIVHHALVSQGVIDEVHASSRKMIVWTVNHATRMRELALAGADGIISDDPGLLNRALQFGRQP